MHVHVRTEKPPAPLNRRFVRWCDRTLLGMVMGIAAFAVERAVLRGTKKSASDETGDEPAARRR